MPFLAGQKLTAGQLDRIQPRIYEGAATSALAVSTTTYADIVGATVTFTTTAANAKFKADAVFDASVGTTSATNLMVGRLVVDGTPDSGGLAVYAMDVQDRATIAQEWTGTLAAAGTHTLKLQGACTASGSGSGNFLQSDTKIIVTVTEVP
ncbi:hypothetical protein AMK26_10320 [Streptomyces sp. CB03234]|uniref:hypothetical protein n=1 Tax=Streptomyces sp. (strain CB03234) TaxID=1703937 RepID=UPI00093CB704|nr:hypothetical protein [Streptomyces sp. CB03234]OKK06412.1 hypothetical protein AMK26_10320 [Streptomyces sp. CB03234]